jgi:hypothetical protein
VPRVPPERADSARWPQRCRNCANSPALPVAPPVQPAEPMKKHKTKRAIALHTETIRTLSDDNLKHVVGGTLQPTAACFIMKDTIIIRTSG